MSDWTQPSVSVPVPFVFGPRLQNGLRFDQSLRTAWEIIHPDAAESAIPDDPQQAPVAPDPGAPPADPKNVLLGVDALAKEA